MSENNWVGVVGELADGFCFSHRACGQDFYSGELEVRRLSGTVDYVPLMVPGNCISGKYDGKMIYAVGELHSYNDRSTGKFHVVTYVAVKRLEILRKGEEMRCNNLVSLNGYLCKKPVFRTTPFKRKIAELKIAVHRPSGKSDYIHCICWGGVAKFAAELDIGASVELVGRIQSRDYVKKLSDTASVMRTTYEVSASEIITIM